MFLLCMGVLWAEEPSKDTSSTNETGSQPTKSLPSRVVDPYNPPPSEQFELSYVAPPLFYWNSPYSAAISKEPVVTLRMGLAPKSSLLFSNGTLEGSTPLFETDEMYLDVRAGGALLTSDIENRTQLIPFLGYAAMRRVRGYNTRKMREIGIGVSFPFSSDQHERFKTYWLHLEEAQIQFVLFSNDTWRLQHILFHLRKQINIGEDSFGLSLYGDLTYPFPNTPFGLQFGLGYSRLVRGHRVHSLCPH